MASRLTIPRTCPVYPGTYCRRIMCVGPAIQFCDHLLVVPYTSLFILAQAGRSTWPIMLCLSAILPILTSLPPDSLISRLIVPAVFPNRSFLSGTWPVYPGRYSRAHRRAGLGRCFEDCALGYCFIVLFCVTD